jgi:Uma2 family endonuclease
MTGEEFLALHGDESGVELVEGRVVRYPMPGAKHGKVCAKATFYLTKYVMEHDLGQVMSNDTFVRTAKEPDSFRGADVCFISYARLPKEQELPRGPIPTPDLIVEVRSPTDRMKAMIEKAYEYLDVGVAVVVQLFPETQTAVVFRPDDIPQPFPSDAELTLPDVLPGFSVPVRSFFE